MGRIRALGYQVAVRVARRVGQSELFEKPGDRAAQAPIATVAHAPPAVGEAAPAADRPVEAAPSAAPGLPGVDTPGGPAACTIAGLDALRARLGPRGGVRVVNHWATWCLPCVEELGLLKQLADQLGDVPLLGVSWDLFDPRGDEDDIREHVENFGAGQGLGWPTLLIAESVPAEAFFEAFSVSFQQIPQTWVIDDAGAVVHRVDGVLNAAAVTAILSAVGKA